MYVSDELMAISQIQTNESAYTMNHTGFYGVAENLSWGYKSYDPYEGWYYDEFENSINGSGETGHYETIISPYYNVTGFAISNNGNFSRTDGQVFTNQGVGSNPELNGFYTYTDYYNRFMDYYNSLMNAPTIADEAKAAMEAAKRELDTAKNNLTKAEESAKTAAQNYTNKQNAEKTALTNKQKAEADYQTALNTVKEKEDARDEANTDVTNAKNDVTAAEKDASSAQKTVDNAKKAADAAKAELDQAKETAEDKKAAADSKVAAFENGLKAMAGKTIVYKQGDKVGSMEAIQGRQSVLASIYSASQNETKQKNDALTKAKEAFKPVKEAYDAAVKEETAKKNALSAAEEERDRIESEIAADIADKRADMESKESALENAEDTLTKAEQSVTDAKDALTTADDKLEEVTVQLANAEAAIKPLIEDKDISQEVKNEIQAEYDALVEAITPLWNAQKAEKEASDAKDNAATEYGNAQADELQAQEDLKAAIQAYEEAKDLKGRADLLSYEDALETPVTDEDFAYLNDYINAIADADAAVVAVQKLADEKAAALADAKKVYEDAKADHKITLANLAAAQADYDRFAQEEADRLAAENAKATAVTLDATATKAARTGDNAPIIGYVAAGTLALVAVAVARPKVLYRKQK